MKFVDEYDIKDFLGGKAFECDCGREHRAQVDYLSIKRGAIYDLPDALNALGVKKPFIVYDKNTFEAAGRQVCEVLDRAGIPYTGFLLKEHGYSKCEPDEYSVGSVAMGFDVKCDCVIAVGGGVINDTCKELALVSGRPQIIIGTAPSMDGFASNSSSMVVDNVKTTLYNATPRGIILDTEIMSKAPMRMLWAGFGDMIAKYISVCEWRISNIVTGEYYCPHVAAVMRRALKRIMDAADGLAKRDPDAVGAVAEGLVLSGIAMSFAKVSRPASGLEHYFSHMWDMLCLERGRESDLHGIQVGVGTVLTLRLYEFIKALTPSREKAEAAIKAFDPEAWEKDIIRVFGKTAPEVLKIEQAAGKNDPVKRMKRVENIIARWDDIQAVIKEELPSLPYLLDIMKRMGMPTAPGEIGFTREDTLTAYMHARDIRDKYLSVSFLWDIGELEEGAKHIFE